MPDNPPNTSSQANRDIYSVSRLNREVKQLLEGSFPLLWVEGELSNLARPSSGHVYFSLKDGAAQARCAMFRNRNTHLAFQPEDGMQVLVRARISLYETRGEYQLIIEHMEPAGDGALRQAFEALKQRLDKEGLFDEKTKQDLPAVPQQIGVITSPTGAAVRDVLSVLKRRFPLIPVIVYPVAVQGEDAAEMIAAMIRTADARRECDVLILGRGGGSLEDLWAFNEEVVARAVFDCSIPIVTGIGHEIDFTIADFVADRRAATPSAAAELVSPDQYDFMASLRQYETKLISAMRAYIGQKHRHVEWLNKRLVHPGMRIQATAQRLDDLEARLTGTVRAHLARLQHGVNALQTRIGYLGPQDDIDRYQKQTAVFTRRLGVAMKNAVRQHAEHLAGASRALQTVSPLSTLGRGYAIVFQEDMETIVRTVDDVREGDTVHSRLQDGQLTCLVRKSDKFTEEL